MTAARRRPPRTPRPPARTSAAALERRLSEQLERVTARLESFPGDLVTDPEAVHRLHQELRRARVGLALLDPLLRGRAARAASALDRRLRSTARLLGEVRDREVALALVRPAPSGRHAGGARVAEDLRRELETGRALVLGRAGSDLGRPEWRRVKKGLARPPPRGLARRWPSIAEGELSRRARGARRALRRARARPSRRRLHRLRGSIRWTRSLRAAMGVVDPDDRRLARLQRLLGLLHDLDLLRARLRRLPALQRAPALERTVRTRRRRLRRRVVRGLGRRSVRRAIGRTPADRSQP